MSIRPLELSGAFEIQLFRHADERGTFFKPFQENVLKDAGLFFEVKESILSISAKNVIRGMHFQTEPNAQCKLVYCPQGAILDVILDIRPNSNTFGKYVAVELSAANGKSLFIPEGFAHGFMALEDNSITSYLMNRSYVPENDKGILYNSFGFQWPAEPSMMSPRDQSFPSLADALASGIL